MIKPGVYQHYKGGYYLVLFTADDSNNFADHELGVVYISLDRGKANFRRLTEFLEEVDGKPRFKYIADRIG